MTADLQVFGIFLWPRNYDLLAFFRDCGPVTFWHFFVTTDLRFSNFRITANLSILCIFPLRRICEFLAFLISFRENGQASFRHFCITAPLSIIYIFFVTADLWVFVIFSWSRTCDFVAFFHDSGVAIFRHFLVTADLRLFGIFPWPRTCEFQAFLYN